MARGAAVVVLALLAGCGREPRLEGAARGILDMRQVPLARFAALVPAGDVERGRCVGPSGPYGAGAVQMELPAAAGEVRSLVLLLDSAGAPAVFGDLRGDGDRITSVHIELAQGTGAALNVSHGRTRMVEARGTADEALRSAALGHPARTIERMLARCGRPAR